TEMIWVAEGLHEKKISQIADRLCQEFPRKRVIFIAGPSASGKTTFSRRLGIQLKVNGLSTWPVSMDNYYLDHDRIPEGQAGPGDFESVSALDVHLLCDHADRLMDGKPIPERKFDFARGEGHETGNLIVVPQNTFIIFEGIHGLNPLFTRRIGQERLQRIYVSAITQLNVDNEHRVSTSDNRLLRRLVRDEKFRGYSCEETLSRWPSVRLGEDRNIFPYQEDADFMFNSSLAYEIPVLANQAVPLLEEIPENHGEYVTAKRLLTFLSFFAKIRVDPIPGTSILRDFMGGSALEE
ncbi:MAG: uridine kinase, partial [Fidelibacterota bacterium]